MFKILNFIFLEKLHYFAFYEAFQASRVKIHLGETKKKYPGVKRQNCQLRETTFNFDNIVCIQHVVLFNKRVQELDGTISFKLRTPIHCLYIAVKLRITRVIIILVIEYLPIKHGRLKYNMSSIPISTRQPISLTLTSNKTQRALYSIVLQYLLTTKYLQQKNI